MNKCKHETRCEDCTCDKVDPEKVVILAGEGKEPDEGEANYVRG